jgi:xanthosine utilization system XapX-like protein
VVSIRIGRVRSQELIGHEAQNTIVVTEVNSDRRPPTVASVFRDSLVGSSRHPVRDYAQIAIFIALLALLLPDPLESSAVAGLVGVLIGTAIAAVGQQRRFGRPATYQAAVALARVGFVAAIFGAWMVAARVVGYAPGASPAEHLAAAVGLPPVIYGAVAVIGFLVFFIWQSLNGDNSQAERDARAERRARAADEMRRR